MSEVFQLEQQLSDAKELLAKRNMALKLSKNVEFRKLILEGFCGTEASRLVQMSSDPALDDRQRADALAMAQASGHLKRFLSMMVTMANVAEREMPDLEQALAEARLEEDAETTETEDQN